MKKTAPILLLILLFFNILVVNSIYSMEAADNLESKDKFSNHDLLASTNNKPRLLREGGSYPKWSPVTNLISYTELVDDTYEVFIMTPDGENISCLTQNKAALKYCGHRGQSYWHPSGDYIVFTAKNKNFTTKGIGITGLPGVGRNHNIWIMTSDGSKFWQITDYPENWGAIRPSFSHDGDMICWSEEYSMEKYDRGSFWGWLNYLLRPGEELGLWRIKMANISFEDNQPEINDIKIAELPEGYTLLEGEGFTPDDNGFVISACDLSENNGKDFWGDIYVTDLNGNIVERLTNTPFQHDENAEYSPDGSKIIWNHAPGFGKEGYPGKDQELYIMNSDGSDKTRLTYFTDPNYPEYDKYTTHCSEITWSPDGKRIVFGHGSRLPWRFTPNRETGLYILSLKPSSLVKNIKIVKENAGHGDWSSYGDLIIFDKQNEDEFFDIYIMHPNGTIIQSITDNSPNVNQRHNGWPTWHPSNEYIVFQSEEEDHYLSDNERFKWIGHPGLGFFNNLWATTSHDNKFWKLTDIEIKKSAFDGIPVKGIVNPQFSNDGSKIMWTERYDGGGYLNWGMWQIKMADFVIENNEPKLIPEGGDVVLRAENICENSNYVVGMDFSPDDKKLLIAGNLDGQHVYGMDQYIYDIETGDLTNLQNTPKYWEEGACWSPDGQKIVYMSNINSPYEFDFNDPDWGSQPCTREYWIMNTDGSNKQQLTYFNTYGSLEYLEVGKGRRIIVAKCSFSPDGNILLGAIGVDQRTDDKADIKLYLGLIEFQLESPEYCKNSIFEAGMNEINLPVYSVNSKCAKNYGGRIK